MESAAARPDLSLVVPALNERANLEELIPALRGAARDLALTHEILVVDGGSTDGTAPTAERLGARVIVEPGGYGAALRVGLAAATGDYVITMDGDMSHDPAMVRRLWSSRHPRGIGIASRYVPGGSAAMSPLRLVLSRILNLVFARGLSLPVRDLSSGFRIYPRGALAHLRVAADDFDALPEILVRAYLAGWHISEVPFAYAPRRSGSSKARLLRLGRAYLRTFLRLRRLRRSTRVPPR